VPLVYGVCRTASAPKLSHGGFRLNASKPEASPKTRCPKHTFKTTVWLAVRSIKRRVRKHHDESPFKTQSALPASLAPSISHDHKLFRCTRVGPTVWTSNNKFQRPSPNERTCMGWHKRCAAASGCGLRGIFVPRR